MSEEFSPQMENEKSRPLPEGQILYKHQFRPDHVPDPEHNARLATDDEFQEKHFGERGLILADYKDSRALLKEGPYATIDLMVMLKAPGAIGFSDMSIEEIKRHLEVVEAIRGELMETFPHNDYIIGVNQGASQSIKLQHTHITGTEHEFAPRPDRYLEIFFPEGYNAVKGTEVDGRVLDLLAERLHALEPNINISREASAVKVKLAEGTLATDENVLAIKIVAEQLEKARLGLLEGADSHEGQEWGSALSINEHNEIVMAVRAGKIGPLEVNGMVLQRENTKNGEMESPHDPIAIEAMRAACGRAKAKLEAEGL